MANHPLNALLRFCLELAAFYGIGLWGWSRNAGWLRWLLALALPVLAMTLWGVFAVPSDPSRGGKPGVIVPGGVRLALELGVFVAGGLGYWFAGREWLASGFAASCLLHHALSFERLRWLLQR